MSLPWLTRLKLAIRSFGPSGGSTGARGERVAKRFLRKAGYRVLATNLRNRYGEVDLVVLAPDGRSIVIVEVKARQVSADESADMSTRPEVHVNAQKQRKLVALASQLARQHGWTDRPIRFDVVGVDLVRGSKPIVRHHIAAFEASV